MSVVRFDGADNNSRWHDLGGGGLTSRETGTLEKAAEDGIQC